MRSGMRKINWRYRALHDFTAYSEPDVECMRVRHFILCDDRPKG